jgi:hypothetical protein
MKTGLGLMMVGVFVLAGCGNAPADTGSEEASSLQLNLTTTAASGTVYRLGPATFNVSRKDESVPEWTLSATGDEPSLNLPLPPESYTVSLEQGWTLSRIDGAAATPVAATLTSEASQRADVFPFQTTPVNFAFRLGESGIDIGVTVDEGIPDGYDGRVVPSPSDPNSYQIEWRWGGSVCCFASFAQAQADYGNAHLLPPP